MEKRRKIIEFQPINFNYMLQKLITIEWTIVMLGTMVLLFIVERILASKLKQIQETNLSIPKNSTIDLIVTCISVIRKSLLTAYCFIALIITFVYLISVQQINK